MKSVFSIFVLLIVSSPALAAELPENPALRDELLAMEARDQELRNAALAGELADGVTSDVVVKADAAHTARMKEILAQHGWPTEALVGKEGAGAAWLLVQHADADPKFQQHALALMEPLLASGEINKRNYAYLWDRTHEPQRYGTQLRCVDGALQPREIESPENVDARRESMGMMPLATYVETAVALLTEGGKDPCKGS